MKFETVQNHFLSDVFGLLSFRNLASMATWRNDFSCVLSQESSLGPDSAVGEKSEKKKKIIGERSEPSSSLGRGKGAPPFPPPQSTAQLADSFYAVSLRFFFAIFRHSGVPGYRRGKTASELRISIYQFAVHVFKKKLN